MFPDYKFCPIHGKHKKRDAKDDGSASRLGVSKDQEQVEKRERLLSKGRKVKKLARAVRDLDRLLNSENDSELDDVRHNTDPFSPPITRFHFHHPYVHRRSALIVRPSSMRMGLNVLSSVFSPAFKKWWRTSHRHDQHRIL